MGGNNIDGGLRPVDRLPPELLAHIFEDVQFSLGWSWDDVGGALGRATWIHLTWACRRWRLAALESPQLWALVIVDHHPWESLVPAFLERSRKLPLAVSIRHASEDVEAILGVCLPHARRIRQLLLEGPIGSLLAPFIGSFDILEEAHLKQNPEYVFEASSGGPVHFLHDDFPRLQVLNLQDMDVAWDTFSVASLYELHCSWPKHRSSLSATRILRIMKDSPELRMLKLPGCSTRLSSTQADPHDITDVMSLTHLENVELHGIPESVNYVLGHFTVPSGDCAIRVTYCGCQWRVPPIGMVLPRQFAFQSLLPNCTTLKLKVVVGGVTLSAFDEPGTCFLALMSWADREQAFITEGIWMSILDVFSCSPLSRFNLAYHRPQSITPQMWTTLFDRFPLDAVEITPCGYMPEERGRADRVENLFEAMRGPASFRIRTPELAALHLTSQTTDAILNLLEYRDSIERPLEKLVFVQCFCESSIDMQWLKLCLESYAKAEIRYGWDTGATEDEFREL